MKSVKGAGTQGVRGYLIEAGFCFFMLEKIMVDKMLRAYFNLQKAIHEYFGYQENWVAIPLDNSAIECEWSLHQDEDGRGVVKYINNGELYSGEIYTQRFLEKWVYETPHYTMVCVDTHTDGNKFLMVFDNGLKKEDVEGDDEP